MKRLPVQTATCSSCTFGTTNPSLGIPTCRHSHRQCLISNAMMVYPIFEICPDCQCHLSSTAGNVPSLSETNSTDLTLRPKQLETINEITLHTDILRHPACHQAPFRSSIPPLSSPQPIPSPPPSPSLSPSSSSSQSTTNTIASTLPTEKERAQSITRQSQQIALVKQYMQVTGMTPPPGYHHIDVKGDVDSVTTSENIEDGSTSGRGL